MDPGAPHRPEDREGRGRRAARTETASRKAGRPSWTPGPRHNLRPRTADPPPLRLRTLGPHRVLGRRPPSPPHTRRVGNRAASLVSPGPGATRSPCGRSPANGCPDAGGEKDSARDRRSAKTAGFATFNLGTAGWAAAEPSPGRCASHEPLPGRPRGAGQGRAPSAPPLPPGRAPHPRVRPADPLRAAAIQGVAAGDAQVRGARGRTSPPSRPARAPRPPPPAALAAPRPPPRAVTSRPAGAAQTPRPEGPGGEGPPPPRSRPIFGSRNALGETEGERWK
ncbi:translation initiation factor IF-2-like [Canis lupus dingo]|uniref:translation initiation factor IF-2-like n=1 Tax=Canis lupus dingo TaxID=286419 RepID=UPI0020C57840|nr:translation initiation factor IF-2-like [Canis lupus dingo]